MTTQAADRAPLEGRDWLQAVGQMLALVGGDRFPIAMRRAVGALCPHDSIVVTAYRGMERPRTLFHDLDEVQAATHTTFYESGPFLLDPFYIACRNGIAPGAYRLMDLAPKAFFKSDYYDTFYRRIRLADEIGLLVADAAGRWIAVSIARGARSAGFTAEEARLLGTAFPVLEAAIVRQWGGGGGTGADRDDRLLRERLAAFGAQVLSPREGEVVRLILNGHSTREIATLLGSAEGTVKVHRRHAYAKLGIASQAELFSLATRFIADGGG
ncbi:LuxR C-terminal-related transcriptional regulator [Rhizobium sp. TRM95111]|uniref:helix-turn-helix transcriptional regulator n=1 Tax=Rhizobium alarense TaxID=2846851 RepID=UPI001F381392|nr:LuxR C-terminal-related transcriptional regulator [Rhizobium alarense]MCF3640632.1 LuxR C-terminal-related transcriptional regulator [Rhizobium alarense]